MCFKIYVHICITQKTESYIFYVGSCIVKFTSLNRSGDSSVVVPHYTAIIGVGGGGAPAGEPDPLGLRQ
jgi:hypothetical protein